MSRELLKRISKFAQKNYPTQMRGLVAEIEVELKKAYLAKPDPTPGGYTGVGLNLIPLEEYEKLQTGMKLLYDTPLYEHPPAQPTQLTDEQIDDLRCRYSNIIIGHPIDIEDLIEFAKLIEKAHGIGDL